MVAEIVFLVTRAVWTIGAADVAWYEGVISSVGRPVVGRGVDSAHTVGHLCGGLEGVCID